MSEEKPKRNPAVGIMPDIDPREKPIIPRPQGHSWRQIGVLVMILVAVLTVVVILHLSEREIVVGFVAAGAGVLVAQTSSESRVERMNERDPLHAICSIVGGMSEKGLWVFTREEEQAVEKLQRILKRFRGELPR